MMDKKLLIDYDNGNVNVKIYTDGTKVRSYDNIAFPKFPESIDVKITNYCDLNCQYCHEMSTVEGKHGNLDKLLEILDVLPAGVELACLEEHTNVFTPNGIKLIKDLSVGDYVYNEQNIPVKIVNIISSEKECIELSFTKGEYNKIVCTNDHIFINSENEEILAKDLLDVKMKIATFNKYEDKTIDLSKYITQRNTDLKSSRGGWFDNTHVKLSHVTPKIDRYITPDVDLMYLYGITVAEGSKKGIALNRNEEEVAKKCIKIYKDKFNIDSSIYYNDRKNSINVEFKKPTIYSRMFFEAMQIGYGARNKSIKYLFGLDKELVRSALFGMFQGDGAFRKRIQKGITTYSLTYKTTSKTLAEELNYILYTYFNVQSSLHYGMSKERLIEGRTLAKSDYYKIDIYGKENIIKLFPDLYKDDKDFNSSSKFTNTKTQEIKCNGIKDVGLKTVYDITLENNSSHLFCLNNGIVTHNCGGGNPLAHPHLIYFLTELKKRGIIPNLTVNQGHLKVHQDLLKYLIEEKLVYGLGISVTSSQFNYVKPLIELTDNVVFHVIAGVNKVEVIDEIMTNCGNITSTYSPKILVLGYKDFGFGVKYHDEKVNQLLKEWYIGIARYLRKVHLSFDNLALEQLDIQRLIIEEYWEMLYMGDDFTFTMYIDAVEQEFAPTSRSIERESFDETDLLTFFANRYLI